MPNRKFTHCKYCVKCARENASMRIELSQLRQHLVSMDSQRREAMTKLETAQLAAQFAVIALKNGSQTGALTALASAIAD